MTPQAGGARESRRRPPALPDTLCPRTWALRSAAALPSAAASPLRAGRRNLRGATARPLVVGEQLRGAPRDSAAISKVLGSGSSATGRYLVAGLLTPPGSPGGQQRPRPRSLLTVPAVSNPRAQNPGGALLGISYTSAPPPLLPANSTCNSETTTWNHPSSKCLFGFGGGVFGDFF